MNAVYDLVNFHITSSLLQGWLSPIETRQILAQRVNNHSKTSYSNYIEQYAIQTELPNPKPNQNLSKRVIRRSNLAVFTAAKRLSTVFNGLMTGGAPHYATWGLLKLGA